MFRAILGGIFLAPVDLLWGITKGLGRWTYAVFTCKPYFWANVREPFNAKEDETEKTATFGIGLGRIGGAIFFALAICGMLGAIAAPFPGTTALYLASLAGAAKAWGITQFIATAYAWLIVGRTAGAFIGSVIDATYVNSKLADHGISVDFRRIRCKGIIKSTTFNYGLYGEGIASVIERNEIKRMKNRPVNKVADGGLENEPPFPITHNHALDGGSDSLRPSSPRAITHTPTNIKKRLANGSLRHSTPLLRDRADSDVSEINESSSPTQTRDVPTPSQTSLLNAERTTASSRDAHEPQGPMKAKGNRLG